MDTENTYSPLDFPHPDARIEQCKVGNPYDVLLLLIDMLRARSQVALMLASAVWQDRDAVLAEGAVCASHEVQLIEALLNLAGLVLDGDLAALDFADYLCLAREQIELSARAYSPAER